MQPGHPFCQQLAPHITPVIHQHFGRQPTLLVSREPSHDNVAVLDEGRRRALCLFPVGLLEFWTIDTLEVNRLASPIVTDRQTIALVDGNDSR